MIPTFPSLSVLRQKMKVTIALHNANIGIFATQRPISESDLVQYFDGEWVDGKKSVGGGELGVPLVIMGGIPLVGGGGGEDQRRAVSFPSD